MRAAWCAVVLLAGTLAGCASDAPPAGPSPDAPPPDADAGTDGPGAPDGAAESDPRDAPVLVVRPAMRHHACRQYHTFFSYPAAAFTEPLPDGFSYATDSTGHLVMVYVHVSSCKNATIPGAVRSDAGAVAEMWASVGVQPPPELARPGVVFHLMALGAVVDNEAVAAAYEAWGFGRILARGQVTWSDVSDAPVRSGRVEVTSPGETFTLTTLERGPQEGDASGSVAVFMIADGALVGGYTYWWPGWTDVGSGTAELSYAGDLLDGAPPVSGGEVHEVSDTDVFFDAIRVPPA